MSKDTVMIEGVEHDLYPVHEIKHVRSLQTALTIAQNTAQYYEQELDKERARHNRTHATLMKTLEMLAVDSDVE